MAPPIAKEQYDRLFAKLAKQHKGVREGSTSKVTAQQLDELSRLQTARDEEAGTPVPERLPSESSTMVDKRMFELDMREWALKEREDKVEQRESEYQQQELLLQALREENEAHRAKNGSGSSRKGA